MKKFYAIDMKNVSLEPKYWLSLNLLNYLLRTHYGLPTRGGRLELVSRSKRREIAQIKRTVVHALHSIGLSQNTIARLMGVHRSTIKYHVVNKNEETELINRIKERICEVYI